MEIFFIFAVVSVVFIFVGGVLVSYPESNRDLQLRVGGIFLWTGVSVLLLSMIYYQYIGSKQVSADNLVTIGNLVKQVLSSDNTATAIALLALLATVGQRKASEHANALKLSPVLVITFKKNDILIKNIGEGTAFDVRITDWLLRFTDARADWKLELSLRTSDYIEGRKDQTLYAKTYVNGTESDVKESIIHFWLKPSEFPSDEERPIPCLFSIYYKDAFGVRYVTTLRTGRGGIRIISPAARLTLWRMFTTWLNREASNQLLNFRIWRSRRRLAH